MLGLALTSLIFVRGSLPTSVAGQMLGTSSSSYPNTVGLMIKWTFESVELLGTIDQVVRRVGLNTSGATNAVFSSCSESIGWL